MVFIISSDAIIYNFTFFEYEWLFCGQNQFINYVGFNIPVKTWVIRFMKFTPWGHCKFNFIKILEFILYDINYINSWFRMIVLISQVINDLFFHI